MTGRLRSDHYGSLSQAATLAIFYRLDY